MLIKSKKLTRRAAPPGVRRRRRPTRRRRDPGHTARRACRTNHIFSSTYCWCGRRARACSLPPNMAESTSGWISKQVGHAVRGGPGDAGGNVTYVRPLGAQEGRSATRRCTTYVWRPAPEQRILLAVPMSSANAFFSLLGE